MSGGGRSYTRRSVAIGGGVAVALGLAAVGINAPRWLRAKTAYDDLLNQLVDRDAALAVGREARAIAASHSDVVIPADTPNGLANALRERIGSRNLRDVTNEELIQGKTLEVRGWVLPQTLVLFCVLAAEVG